jgi:hypothetical protein
VEWTVHGTIWYLDISKKTPDCIPSDRLPPLIIWWIFVCYVILIILFGVLIYEIVCMIKKRRITALIQNYLNNENPYQDVEYLNGLLEGGDLSPDEIPMSKNEITKLESIYYHLFSIVEYQCSICCEDIKHDELIIKLFGCSHMFHKNCLEQWLSRKPLCPNCKRNVRNDILLRCKNVSIDRRTNEESQRNVHDMEEEKV